MTFFEKWKQDHPGPHVGMGFPPDCPHHYGYAKPLDSDCETMSCSACWQREIPEEVVEEKKPITFLEKWKQEHPDDKSRWPSGCPSRFGYESNWQTDKDCIETTCEQCWKREIPEEKKVDKKTIYAHMGFTEEQAEVIEDLNEGKKIPNDVREMFGLPKILDSGARREFGTGAVRDIQEGKGRCDLLPLDVIAVIYAEESEVISWIFDEIHAFKQDGGVGHLFGVINYFRKLNWWDCCETMLLEVSIHFEEGAKKYGENNWQKGIPVHCYIDSAVRHYLKFLRGDKDEPHDRAMCWNLMCAIWTCKHKPELNDYAQRDTSEVEKALG